VGGWAEVKNFLSGTQRFVRFGFRLGFRLHPPHNAQERLNSYNPHSRQHRFRRNRREKVPQEYRITMTAQTSSLPPAQAEA